MLWAQCFFCFLYKSNTDAEYFPFLSICFGLKYILVDLRARTPVQLGEVTKERQFCFTFVALKNTAVLGTVTPQILFESSWFSSSFVHV